MKNLTLIIGIVMAVVVFGGAGWYLSMQTSKSVTKSSSTSSNLVSNMTNSAQSNSQSSASQYEYFSDKSITKSPSAGFVFGAGEVFAVTYDGSAFPEDTTETLSYYPFYFQDNGSVVTLGGGNLYSQPNTVFSTESMVFTSDANNRKGFIEVIATSVTNQKGTNKTLGRYPVKFEVK